MLRLALSVLLLLGSLAGLALAAPTGERFVVTVTSSAAPAPVTVTTWIDQGLSRSETTTGSQMTIAITREGKTFLLDPVLELAQVAPVRTPTQTPSETKYWGLVDPLQVAPSHLVALFTELGARSLGTDRLDGIAVSAHALTIPAGVNFPLNNLKLYVREDTGLPYRLDYQRNREEEVQVRFQTIETGLELDAALFTVPAEFKLVEYEW